MNPFKINTIIKYRWRLLLTAALLFANAAQLQGMPGLIDALVENNALTEEQARALREQMARSRPTVEPAGTNFRDFRIRGRIQTQFGYTNVSNDEISEDYSTLELRRVRLGARGHLLQNVRAQLEANLLPNGFSMRSAFLQWREHDAAHIKVGFDKPTFGFEEITSSASILTVERTLINNTVAPGAQLGVAIDGSQDRFSYGAGVYTDRANMNPAGEPARHLYNLSAGVNLGDLIGNGQDLDFRADFIASDDGGGNFGGAFKNGISVSGHYVRGPFDLRTEFITVEDRAEDNTYGWYIMPSLYFTDKIQGVLRYEEAYSDDDFGLRAASRYARQAPGLDNDRGDTYRAIYAGANYYFAGDANKVMGGVELSQLDDTADGDLKATTVYGAWRVLF